MKTVLQYDEENDAFKPKPSVLQVFLLEKAAVDDDDGQEEGVEEQASTGSKTKIPTLNGV